MGRAARNYGGTGGHGYLPLPGERPNYNRHVIQDKVLFNMVKNSVQKQGGSTKLKILKQRSNEAPHQIAKKILPTRQSETDKKEKASVQLLSSIKKQSTSSNMMSPDYPSNQGKLFVLEQSIIPSMQPVKSKETQRDKSLKDQVMHNSTKSKDGVSERSPSKQMLLL